MTAIAVSESRHLTAALILDVVDVYGRERGTRGPRPRPITPVSVTLVARIDGANRIALAEPLALTYVRNGDGYLLFFGLYHRPGEAQARRDLPQGRHVVRVEGDAYQRAEVEVDLPTAGRAYAVELEPGPRYPFPLGGMGSPSLLRGAVQAAGGAPVEGATVSAPGARGPCVTQADGQWAILFTGAAPATATVTILYPDGSSVAMPDVPLVARADTTLPQTALRGYVVGPTGLALRGAAVRVGGHPGVAPTGADGLWSYFFPFDQGPAAVDVTASLPDGRSQTRLAVHAQPRATVVVPTFRFV